MNDSNFHHASLACRQDQMMEERPSGFDSDFAGFLLGTMILLCAVMTCAKRKDGAPHEDIRQEDW